MSSHIEDTKCYVGDRLPGGKAVVAVHVLTPSGVDTYPLLHVVRHSPDGFNWGYRGSGPADLARSILTDCLGQDPVPQLYHAFKDHFIAPLDQDGPWHIDEASIYDWLRSTTDAQQP
jgi:hypothetical protein